MGGRGSISGMSSGGSTVAASAGGGGVSYIPTPSEYSNLTPAAKEAYIQALPLGESIRIESSSTSGGYAYVIKQPGAKVGTSYYTVDYDTSGGHVHYEVDTPSQVRKRLRSSGFKNA